MAKVTAADLDNMAWTMLGEAWPGDIAGMTAVGSVINNRLQSGNYGSSITHIVKAPNQFATWGIGSQAKSQGNNPDRRFSTMSPQFQQARALAQQIADGQVTDPTGGAVEYRQTGSTRRQGTDIGGNTFFAPSGTTALGYASSGKSSQTSAIQQQLANAGFNPGAIDGINGPRTKAAVRAFQQANGLTADGIVGPQTSAVMAAMGGAKSPPPLPTTFGGRLPAQAQYGIDRLVSGQVTRPPNDFTTDQTGNYDPRLASMMGLKGALSVGGGVAGVRPVSGAASLAGMPPLPIPRPALQPPVQTAPPSPAPQVPRPLPQAPAPSLRLASGKSIAPGIYTQPDGHSVQVSDAGDGTAKITQIHGPGFIPGVMDPLREVNAPTIAGGMIRSMLPKLATDAVSSFNAPAAVDAVRNSALGAASNLGTAAQNFGGGILGGLGGLFGQHPSLPNAGGLFGGVLGQRAPTPMPGRPAGLFSYAAPQQRQQAPSQTRTQRAQQDLRDAGMLDQFGMIR